MPFRVKFADRVRAHLKRLPSNWAEVLTHRLRQIADLAEIHPVSRAFQGPVSMQTVVDGLQVHYEIDRDQRQLTVVEIMAAAHEDDPDAQRHG